MQREKHCASSGSVSDVVGRKRSILNEGNLFFFDVCERLADVTDGSSGCEKQILHP